MSRYDYAYKCMTKLIVIYKRNYNNDKSLTSKTDWILSQWGKPSKRLVLLQGSRLQPVSYFLSSEHFVSIDLFLKCNKVKKLGVTTRQQVIDAIK